MGILPIGSPFPCGMCGLCPGPPAEGPCGRGDTAQCVGKIWSPKPSTWKCKFDPEEKFLNSPARVKSRSNPVPQRFISSPAREKSKSSPLPRSFSARQLEKRRKQPARGRTRVFSGPSGKGMPRVSNPTRQQDKNRKRELQAKEQAPEKAM